MKLEVLEDDTGAGTQVVRGNYNGTSDQVLFNIEFPNGEAPTPIPGMDNSTVEDVVNINMFLSTEGVESPERISEGIADLTRVRDLMRDRGYDGEFEKSNDYLEYVFQIPFRNEAHLGRILRDISCVDGAARGSTGRQLEQLFARKLDEQTLDGLIGDVDAKLERVTVDTGSTGVVRFDSDGKVGYGKVSTSKPALMNESKALEALQGDRRARVLAPIPIGLAMQSDAGALFTWGTQNTDLYEQEDLKQDSALFNTLLYQYATQSGEDLSRLARDPRVRDVFNRAIIHTSLKEYTSLNPGIGVHDIEVLEDRADNGDQLLPMLRIFTPVYIDAAKRVGELNPGNPVFIHGDARPENIGEDGQGKRPLIDWANAGMGSFAQDFASLESEDSGKYLDWYKYVLSARGASFVDEDAKELLVCHDVLQPYRTGSFKVGKGRFDEAARDIRRLERNVGRYKEMFS
jgi:hypothetical protein